MQHYHASRSLLSLVFVLLKVLDIEEHGSTNQKRLVCFLGISRKNDLESIHCTAQLCNAVEYLDNLTVLSTCMILNSELDWAYARTTHPNLTQTSIRRVDQVVLVIVKLLIDTASHAYTAIKRIFHSTQECASRGNLHQRSTAANASLKMKRLVQ